MRPITTNMLLTYLICAALLTGIVSPANAIEYARPALDEDQETSAYVNVGALGVDFDGPMGNSPPFGLCSGFVISDRAFVTAAHCITTFDHLGVHWAVTIESGSPDSPVTRPGPASFVNLPPILVATESTMTVHLHPRFIRESCNEESCEFDVAVLEFEPGTFKVPPVRLARFGLLRWLKRLGVLKKLAVGLVGYGAETEEEVGPGQLVLTVPGYRARGFSSLARMSRTRLFLKPTPELDSSLLNGDSGSPQFILGRVVSLSSITGAGEQRLDIPAVRRFLAPFIRR